MSSERPNIKKLLTDFANNEVIRKRLELVTRSSDVIIVGEKRCGTTWMQQILHQLRTGGDMDYEKISHVVPWIESPFENHYDIDKNQKAEPRLFKSHVAYKFIPKGCKYVVMYRDPCVAAYSFFRLKEGILFEKGSISADEFVTETWLQLGVPENPDQPYDESYFRHLLSWYEHRNDPNVLLLFCEEMVEDIVSVVQALANFLDLKEEKNIRAALQNSSFDVMKLNWQKFSIEKSSTDSESLTGTKPLRLQFSIVGTGKSAIEAQSGLSDEVKATIQEYWNKDILSVSGCETYEELRRKVRRERPLKTASGCI